MRKSAGGVSAGFPRRENTPLGGFGGRGVGGELRSRRALAGLWRAFGGWLGMVGRVGGFVACTGVPGRFRVWVGWDQRFGYEKTPRWLGEGLFSVLGLGVDQAFFYAGGDGLD